MGWWDDNLGIWSDSFYFENEDEESSYFEKKERTCNFCGKEGLVWNEVKPGVVKLVDRYTYTEHRCKQSDKLKQAANDFKDIPL